MATNFVFAVETSKDVNASRVGERYGAFDGVEWYGATDSVDSDGNGRVWLECDDRETFQLICNELSDDDDVVSFEVAI